MKNQTSHTSGEWTISGETDVYAPGPDGKILVATCDESNFIPYPEKVANAELIVRAVNAHADLLAACKALLQFEQRIMSCNVDGGKAIVEQARAAILKAQGGAK